MPEDLSIVGFDGTDVADFLGLTTIDQRLDESGRLAAEMLMSRISDRGRPPQNTRLQLNLIERSTSVAHNVERQRSTCGRKGHGGYGE